MARVIGFGPPVNDAERRTIATLRDGLPDHYVLLHNFEFKQGRRVYEIDLAVLTPHGVFIGDAKGTHGLIEVYRSKWYPQHHPPYFSPFLKLRDHAKGLKSLVTDLNPGKTDLERVYFDTFVILTEADAAINDPAGKDQPFVVKLDKAAAYFQNPNHVPSTFNRSIGALQGLILSSIEGKAKKPSRPEQYRDWIIAEKLGGTDLCTEYRARHCITPRRTALVRLYEADPYLEEEPRKAQARRISNAFQALARVPAHAGIVAAREFFRTEEEDRYVLVLEDMPARALRQHFTRPELALTFDQKRRITRDLLSALAHAHAYQVVHRNLTPDTVLVGQDGQARLTGFDFARAGDDQSRTIADQIIDDLDPAYQAPELLTAVAGTPKDASAASDVFSLGLILHELYTDDRPFATPEAMVECEARLPAVSLAAGDRLLGDILDWVQALCAFAPEDRLTADLALERFDALQAPPEEPPPPPAEPPPPSPSSTDPPAVDYALLAADTLLAGQYEVKELLGKGTFGVVYRVIDTLADRERAVKIVTKDKHSLVERLRKEYRILLDLPPHANVVKVVHAALLPDNTPYLVFEYVEGLDIGKMLEEGSLTPADAVKIARDVAGGLAHLHAHRVYHCDVKPRNLIWTSDGARLIDFNVAVGQAADGSVPKAGGTRRYIPPDYDLDATPTAQDLIDRDLFALGVTLYECATRQYPWSASPPPRDTPGSPPTQAPGCADLAEELVRVMQRAIAPRRAERFGSAVEFIQALAQVSRVRQLPRRPGILQPAGTVPLPTIPAARPNTNPFVAHLLTLYSQSRHTNAGTRGLDNQIYAVTALDSELAPQVLEGAFKLVVITGNAGDGKTAFLETLERHAKEKGATVTRQLNRRRIELDGRVFELNHDGSQDEGDKVNDQVLEEFLGGYADNDTAAWPTSPIRLIAINEGRLIDFLETHAPRYRRLGELVRAGLRGAAPAEGVVVVNLNLRSVVADLRHRGAEPLLDQLLRQMTASEHWQTCESCDLKEKCYARHNALTFQDPTNGARVTERLRALLSLVHLRGRLHITLRDLRSMLAFMLVGDRDCDEIHRLYDAGRPEEILDSFYFNSWTGGARGSADRLLTQMRAVDVGQAVDPRLDRSLNFVAPGRQVPGLSFESRPTYDLDLLATAFDRLPRDAAAPQQAERFAGHKRYVVWMRRRHYFECRDDAWKRMWPYRSADRMLRLVRGEEDLAAAVPEMLEAINRGEGLDVPGTFGRRLALQVAPVERATIRSYRLFPGERFRLEVRGAGQPPPYVEYLPTGLVLRYADEQISLAEMELNLDVFEMLERLRDGYLPSVEERQGYYLSLQVFKNVLGSATYREVLLTHTGQDFYRIENTGDGRLRLTDVAAGGG